MTFLIFEDCHGEERWIDNSEIAEILQENSHVRFRLKGESSFQYMAEPFKTAEEARWFLGCIYDALTLEPEKPHAIHKLVWLAQQCVERNRRSEAEWHRSEKKVRKKGGGPQEKAHR